MIKISLKDITHSYRGKATFSPLSFDFQAGTNSVILGKNGSGKSTLLKIISSFLEPTNGSIIYQFNGNKLPLEKVPFQTTICSPSALLEEKMTLSETFDFYYSLRELKEGLNKHDFFESCFLNDSVNKRVKELSSGMTQRLKLALSFLTKSNLILLDEPCMNLDEQGKNLYLEYTTKFGLESTQIVASNSVEIEYNHCTSKLVIPD